MRRQLTPVPTTTTTTIKVENVVAGNSPFCRKSLPKCIIDMTVFLERTRSYAHHMKENGLLVDLLELQKNGQSLWSTSIRATFVSPEKTPISNPLYPQRVIWGKGYIMWDVLLHTPADCEDASSRDFIKKDLIIKHRTLYQYLKSLFRSYGCTLPITWINFVRYSVLPWTTWTFEIIIDCKAFPSMYNCLEAEGQKMPAIVTGC